MSRVAQPDRGSRPRLAPVVSRPAVWAAIAAVAGGLLGAATLAFCLLPSDEGLILGCSLDRFSVSVRVSRVLTTLALGGICVLLAEPRVRFLPWASGTLVVLLSAVTVVWAVLTNWYADMPAERAPGVSDALLYSSVTVLWGRPVLMVILGVALLWTGRRLSASLLFALGALEMLPIGALSPGTILSGSGWSVLLLGSHEFGVGAGLIGGTGWTLLGVAIFFSDLKLKERLSEERRRTVEEENLSLARRLYEVAWGTGNLPEVDELVSEEFVDHRHDRRGSEGLKRSISDLHRAFPDLDLSIEEQTAEGDTVTTRCVFSGTDRGGVLWYPPTNRHATFAGTFEDRFADGRPVEHRGEIDTADLLRQLGLPLPD